jgi:hypothetical protein
MGDVVGSFPLAGCHYMFNMGLQILYNLLRINSRPNLSNSLFILWSFGKAESAAAVAMVHGSPHTAHAESHSTNAPPVMLVALVTRIISNLQMKEFLNGTYRSPNLI